MAATGNTAGSPGLALSMVICTLDESDSIGNVLDELRDHLNGLHYELIVVDDSADERTSDVVRGRATSDPRIRLLHRRNARGLASAAIAGWDMARGRVLGLMDGDGQHDPALLRRMLESLDVADADLAVGSRYCKGAHTGLCGFRHYLSKAGTGLTHLVAGGAVTDPLSGLFMFTRQWLGEVRDGLSGLGFKVLIDVATAGKRTPKVVEVPTALRTRVAGESKLDARVGVELLAQLAGKLTGGLVSLRFAMFAFVGATGVIVHLGMLSLLHGLAHVPFTFAQGAAILVAMTWNFFLNDLLTFHDRRLARSEVLSGLFRFYLMCAGGALINEAIATTLKNAGLAWSVAGVAGVLAGAVWNYWSVTRFTWAVGNDAADAPAPGIASIAPK